MHQEKILVVIQMNGGNDGINTLVPFRDELYAKHRKSLRLPNHQLIPISDDFALHPAMRDAADLWEDGRWSVIQSVGYPEPNRSHDVSLSIWESGKPEREGDMNVGWLGKAFDSQEAPLNSGHPSMVLMADQALPLALRGRRAESVVMADMRDLKQSAEVPPDFETHPLANQLSDQASELLGFVQRTTEKAGRTVNAIQSALDAKSSGSSYPSTRLAGRLKDIAALIKSGFSTSVYYAIQSGYDTHAAQLPAHARLLREMSSGVKAFLDDLEASGLADRVLVFAFSEFGRRVAENASQGTDHGAAGPVFLAGRGVRGGLHGEPSSMADLLDGDLRMRTDFRSVHASILSDWLELDVGPAMAGSHPPMDGLFKAERRSAS